MLGGLEGSSSTLALRGYIVSAADTAKTAIETVKFTLSSAAQASEEVDLSSTGVVITYLDQDQALNCTNGSGSGASYCFWTTNWVIGSADLVDPGEQVDVKVDLSNMTPTLGLKKEFTIQVKPNKGAVVIVNRTTPPEFKAIQSLIEQSGLEFQSVYPVREHPDMPRGFRGWSKLTMLHRSGLVPPPWRGIYVESG